MSFQITAISTRIVDHVLDASRIIVSPAGRHDVSQFLTVTLRDENGTCGWGEAATTPLWSGETAETAQCLVENLFAPRLLGCSFEHPREVLEELDKACFGNSFSKSAIDTAVWDLWGRAQGLPATALFGDRTPSPSRSIPIRASVGCYEAAQTVRIAQEFWRAGVRTLKFKVGLHGVDDVARLRAVRESLGDEPIFTVDANGAYTSEHAAVAAIEALLPFDLSLVEQPTPRDRISLLARVRRRTAVPILADECVFTPDDLHEVLDCDACDYVSLYPGKNGGVTHTLDMARIAQSAGKKCVIGSNLETDLGQGAMAAIAASLTAFPIEELACDLPATLFYQGSAIVQPMALYGGRVAVPHGPGFGVEPLKS